MRKSARRGVDEHPGLRDAPRAKRTSEQKKADDAKAAAAKKASEQAQRAEVKAKVNKLALLEDRARQAEKDSERGEIRPDLVHEPPSSPKHTTSHLKPPKPLAVTKSAKKSVANRTVAAMDRAMNY